ncbi:MAG: hypothetical protein KJO94_01310 [Eudoraea sp.]|nr:hypothetical protein [Eudoraea sp.]MBT8322091.1 hypothetical protein [Eudoraea sp.]NNJ40938.1 hypothetical protein [Eudoraea sp.]
MKLFRNLRHKLLHEGRFSRYMLYAIGEILLVMIGILLAFQVDKWNDKRLNRIEELKYYNNLKGDLEQQRYVINGQLEHNGLYLDIFKYALEVSTKGDRTQQDTLIATVPGLFEYSDFDQNGNIYETLVNSGDIKLLENTGIIKGIRRIEWRYQYMNRMENIHWDVILDHVSGWAATNFNFTGQQPISSETLYSYEFQNILVLLQRVMEEKDVIYRAAIEEIDLLIKEVEEEIKKGN